MLPRSPRFSTASFWDFHQLVADIQNDSYTTGTTDTNVIIFVFVIQRVQVKHVTILFVLHCAVIAMF